jgi:DeoR/GlpR family transcriptional regulator of sugar metabolism
LILIGGELRRLSQTLTGPLTRHLLEQLNFDKAFMGTMGATLREGLSTTDPGEAYTKQLVMSRAAEVYLLADVSKFGKVSFAHAGKLEDVTCVITAGELEPRLEKELKRKGIKIVRGDRA